MCCAAVCLALPLGSAGTATAADAPKTIIHAGHLIAIPAKPSLEKQYVSVHPVFMPPRSLTSIETGKFADVIAVPHDPREDLHEMGKVIFVMKESKTARDDSRDGG